MIHPHVRVHSGHQVRLVVECVQVRLDAKQYPREPAEVLNALVEHGFASPLLIRPADRPVPGADRVGHADDAGVLTRG